MTALMRLLACLACAVCAAAVRAETFPSRPVHVIVPWPPGAVDIYLRAMQEVMRNDLGQPILIENKPGANGFIGTMQAAASKPDGHTLLFNVSSSIVMGPLTSAEAKFDARRDFAPITTVFTTPMVLVGKPSIPARSLPELMDWLQRNPKQNYGSPGTGSMPHLLGETLKIAGKLDLIHVSYRGFVPMIQAVTGGEIAVGFIAVATAKPFIMSGRMTAFAVDRGPVNDSELPRLANLTDAIPGFETAPTFAALWAPAGTPRPIIDRLNKAAVSALAHPDVRAKIELGGQTAGGDTPEQLAAIIKANVEASSRLVDAAKAAGATFD